MEKERVATASLFPARKREAGWNQGDRPDDAGKNPGSRIVKGCKSETAGDFQIHSRKTRLTRARAPELHQRNPDSPPYIYIRSSITKWRA